MRSCLNSSCRLSLQYWFDCWLCCRCLASFAVGLVRFQQFCSTECRAPGRLLQSFDGVSESGRVPHIWQVHPSPQSLHACALLLACILKPAVEHRVLQAVNLEKALPALDRMAKRRLFLS